MTTIMMCGIGAVVMVVVMMLKSSLDVSANTYGRRHHIGQTARWNRKAGR